ncbi:hypothetical protein B296_00042192 [Ensete ventricosum]|uniref:Uncharacterized protein n=1 Tax=Ensete ventricosum TaxID=4639 RepID=A0A426X4Q5_ENSVE|nr:hypothetical protein B296_00042192 [Ensete ventricosum]
MAPTVHGNATTTKRIGAIEENKNKQSLQVEDGVKNLDDWQIEPSPTLPPFPLKKILLSLDCGPQSPGPFSPRSRLRGDQPRARNRGLGQGEKEASGERRIGAMEGRFSIRTWLGCSKSVAMFQKGVTHPQSEDLVWLASVSKASLFAKPYDVVLLGQRSSRRSIY